MYDAGNGYHHDPAVADLLRRHGDNPLIAGLAANYQAQKSTKAETQDTNGGIFSTLMKRARDAGHALMEFASAKLDALKSLKIEPVKASRTGEIFRQSLGITSAFVIKGSHAAARRVMRMVNKIHKMAKPKPSTVLDFSASVMNWRHEESLASAVLQIANGSKDRSLYFDSAFKGFRALTGEEAKRSSGAVVPVKPAELAAMAADTAVYKPLFERINTVDARVDRMIADLFEEELVDEKNASIQFNRLLRSMQEQPETFCPAGMSRKEIKRELRRRSYSDCSTFENQDVSRLRSNSEITKQMMQVMDPKTEGFAYLQAKLSKAQRLIDAASHAAPAA